MADEGALRAELQDSESDIEMQWCTCFFGRSSLQSDSRGFELGMQIVRWQQPGRNTIGMLVDAEHGPTRLRVQLYRQQALRVVLAVLLVPTNWYVIDVS